MERLEYSYAKLRGRIIEKYGTVAAFAKHIDRSMNSVSKKLNGRAVFTQRDINLWAESLDFGPDEYGDYFFS